MSSLTAFTYTDQQVRTVTIDDEPWFVAADVCDYFGVTNRNRVMQGVDAEDKGGTQIDTPGGRQTVATVNESGLYSLLFALRPTKARGLTEEETHSRVEQVRKFKRWVTHEVLPQIRKTGSYGGEIAQMPLSEQFALAAEAARKAEELEALRAIDAPKVEAFDQFMDADGAYTMDAAAKSLADVTGGMGRNRLFSFLRERQVLMSGNRPYQRYADWFKVVVNTYEDYNGVPHTTYTTHVKPKGLDSIRRMFSKEIS